MLKHHLLIIAFLVSGILNLKAQNKLPAYQSKKFRSLDFNVGVSIAPLKTYPIPLTIVYQQNIKKGFSWILLSQFYAKFNDDQSLNESFNSCNWVEAVGIGGILGNKWFNNGIFLVGGGRYYRSKVTVNKSALFNEPTLVTNKLNPELALLYNLKIGKKKLYFTSQVYVPILPYKNFSSNLHTFSIGVGYRFKGKG